MEFEPLRYARVGHKETAGETYYARLSYERSGHSSPRICVDFLDFTGESALEEDTVFDHERDAVAFVERRFGDVGWIDGSP